MNTKTRIRYLASVSAVTLLTSCASVQQHPLATGIEIRKVDSPSGRIKQADFVTDQHGVHFHGEVTAIPFSRGPFSGHVDVEIRSSDRSQKECMIVHYSSPSRNSRSRFSLQLDAIPERGSLVQVWHHDAEHHHGCND